MLYKYSIKFNKNILSNDEVNKKIEMGKKIFDKFQKMSDEYFIETDKYSNPLLIVSLIGGSGVIIKQLYNGIILPIEEDISGKQELIQKLLNYFINSNDNNVSQLNSEDIFGCYGMKINIKENSLEVISPDFELNIKNNIKIEITKTIINFAMNIN